MCRAVRDCLVVGYEPLVESLTLPDPDDRHVPGRGDQVTITGSAPLGFGEGCGPREGQVCSAASLPIERGSCGSIQPSTHSSHFEPGWLPKVI